MNQQYDQYTAEDHQVWNNLYGEQMKQLPDMATKAFMDGIKKVGFKSYEVPRFEEVNDSLKHITGWMVYAVPGYVDNFPFFSHLARKEFPVTTWLRRMDKFDYIVEPDMFHDVFGHVPLLSEQFFCDFLEGISAIGLKYIDNPSALELISRVYWYTVEFGLIQESEGLRIYGAGILSSPGESRYCLSDAADPIRFVFDVDTILGSPYIKEKFQEKYFVVESYQQLADSIPAIDRKIQEYIDKGIYVEPNAVMTERMSKVM